MFRNLALLIVCLAFCMVLAGAFVRLSDAGLACPDWPGCFGQLGMPDSRIFTDQAEQTRGVFPPDLGKARISMSHRYLAGLTGGLILVFWLASFFVRVHRKTAILLTTLLAATVVLQITIGMGVVHFKLMPVLVLAHLLSGLLTLSLAFWIFLRINPKVSFVESRSAIGLWAKFSLLVLVLEIMLGNWTGANYAALACPDFPTCLGSWWPHADYFRIFSVFQGIELNYQRGVLSHDARIAINWLHRLGAFLSFLVLGGLALSLSSSKRRRRLRKAGVSLSALLLVQIALGIGMVIFRMPIPVAVGHSGVAALMLLTVIYINFWASREIGTAAETLVGLRPPPAAAGGG
ncbi:MAG: COX15/CtaA family protein, partial [Methylococcales bacterium]